MDKDELERRKLTLKQNKESGFRSDRAAIYKEAIREVGI